MPQSDSNRYSRCFVSLTSFITFGLPVLVAVWLAFEMATKPSMNNLNGGLICFLGSVLPVCHI